MGVSTSSFFISAISKTANSSSRASRGSGHSSSVLSYGLCSVSGFCCSSLIYFKFSSYSDCFCTASLASWAIFSSISFICELCFSVNYWLLINSSSRNCFSSYSNAILPRLLICIPVMFFKDNLFLALGFSFLGVYILTGSGFVGNILILMTLDWILFPPSFLFKILSSFYGSL